MLSPTKVRTQQDRDDLGTGDDAAQAERLALARIDESFDATVALQTDPQLANADRGFLLVFVNSFNEWHEGRQFEPALSAHELSPSQRAVYHNPPDGDARLTHLRSRLAEALDPPDPVEPQALKRTG